MREKRMHACIGYQQRVPQPIPYMAAHLKGFQSVAKPGIKLSWVQQISSKKIDRKSNVINKKWSKQFHLSHFIE
jgi:hypothetical protein